MNDSDIKLTFVHPSPPSVCLMYPSLPDILWIMAPKVFTKADPESELSHTCYQ
jgi:hypothetical protein